MVLIFGIDSQFWMRNHLCLRGTVFSFTVPQAMMLMLVLTRGTTISVATICCCWLMCLFRTRKEQRSSSDGQAVDPTSLKADSDSFKVQTGFSSIRRSIKVEPPYVVQNRMTARPHAFTIKIKIFWLLSAPLLWMTETMAFYWLFWYKNLQVLMYLLMWRAQNLTFSSLFIDFPVKSTEKPKPKFVKSHFLKNYVPDPVQKISKTSTIHKETSNVFWFHITHLLCLVFALS